MAAENFILKYIQVDVVDYFSQYYCFYCIFFINAALVSIKVFFQKHWIILLSPKHRNDSVYWLMLFALRSC